MAEFRESQNIVSSKQTSSVPVDTFYLQTEEEEMIFWGRGSVKNSPHRNCKATQEIQDKFSPDIYSIFTTHVKLPKLVTTTPKKK